MTENFKSFRCVECGGTVRLLSPSGETREYARGLSAPIPKNILIPKCDRCGEVYFNAKEGEQIDAVLRQARLQWQRETVAPWLDFLKQDCGLTIRQVEEACRVTPTYLSHVANGTKIASPTVIRLLELYVRHPEEICEQSSPENFLQAPASPADGFGTALSAAHARWGQVQVHHTAQRSRSNSDLVRMQA